jgi:uncharacterized protein YifE (UPF0438 family)
MSHPTDHAALLARRDFQLPPGDYSEAQLELLAKFGRWLEGLANGSISPVTPAQEQFVECARGRREPQTDFEHAWRAVLRNRGIGFDVGDTFRTLAQARAEKARVEEEYEAARRAVLAKVKDELAAVDEAFAQRLAEAAEVATQAEQAARDIVLRTGKSIHLAGIRATYAAPRVSWDTPKLEAYAREHPEVLAFRKLGKPIVSLRFLRENTAESDNPAASQES